MENGLRAWGRGLGGGSILRLVILLRLAGLCPKLTIEVPRTGHSFDFRGGLQCLDKVEYLSSPNKLSSQFLVDYGYPYSNMPNKRKFAIHVG